MAPYPAAVEAPDAVEATHQAIRPTPRPRGRLTTSTAPHTTPTAARTASAEPGAAWMEPMSAADEILDIVDENDEIIGQSPRGEAYAQGLRHRCVFIEARDARGRLFVHRRTPTKLVFPSFYDMFVGGVVGAGESYDDAALREAEEELGVSGLPGRLRCSSSCTTTGPARAGGRPCTRSAASFR